MIIKSVSCRAKVTQATKERAYVYLATLLSSKAEGGKMRGRNEGRECRASISCCVSIQSQQCLGNYSLHEPDVYSSLCSKESQSCCCLKVPLQERLKKKKDTQEKKQQVKNKQINDKKKSIFPSSKVMAMNPIKTKSCKEGLCSLISCIALPLLPKGITRDVC